VQACKRLCEVKFGDVALKERQCQYWFARFRSGDCSVKDAPRSGRPLDPAVSSVPSGAFAFATS